VSELHGALPPPGGSEPTAPQPPSPLAIGSPVDQVVQLPAEKVEPKPPPKPCAMCRQPLEGALVHCAGCGAAYHGSCAKERRRCLRPSCPTHEPTHPRWTREARAEGLWLELPAPETPVWLRRVVAVLGLFVAGIGANPMIPVIAGTLVARIDPDLPWWAGVSAGIAFVCVPTIGAFVGMFHQYSQYRPVLVDSDGFVLGRTERWRGLRLRWERMAGFRVTSVGVQVAVRGRPWTQWFGPVVLCDERTRHELTLILEEHQVFAIDG
jgi:hypothetical protein